MKKKDTETASAVLINKLCKMYSVSPVLLSTINRCFRCYLRTYKQSNTWKLNLPYSTNYIVLMSTYSN